jgi:hypothetical protein
MRRNNSVEVEYSEWEQLLTPRRAGSAAAQGAVRRNRMLRVIARGLRQMREPTTRRDRNKRVANRDQ